MILLESFCCVQIWIEIFSIHKIWEKWIQCFNLFESIFQSRILLHNSRIH